jgi:hypothetical protein
MFSSPIANLKPASPLAIDDDLAVPRAQFDLANSAGAVNLRGDQGRVSGSAGLPDSKAEWVVKVRGSRLFRLSGIKSGRSLLSVEKQN